MNTLLTASLTTVYERLADFASLEGLLNQFDTVFGSQYNQSLIEMLRSHWQSGNFSQLPPIEVISSDILGSARGAYASSTNKIYGVADLR